MINNQNQNDLLKVNGINSKGFGTIPKLVMQDKDLSIEAKAIYAYFASYAGAGTTAFPSVSLTCSHLNISKSRYYKHRKQLEDKNYISIDKNKEPGQKFTNNVYILNNSPCPSFRDTGFGDTEFEYTGNGDTENWDTNINSSKTNSININNTKSNSSNKDAAAEEESENRDHDEILNRFSSLKGGLANTRDSMLITETLEEFSKDEIIKTIEEQEERKKTVNSFAYIQAILKNRKQEKKHFKKNKNNSKKEEVELTQDDVRSIWKEYFGEDIDG